MLPTHRSLQCERWREQLQSYEQRDARKAMGIQRRKRSHSVEQCDCRDFIICLHKHCAELSIFPAGLMLASSLVYFKLCTCREVVWVRWRGYEHTLLCLMNSYIGLLQIKLVSVIQSGHGRCCLLIPETTGTGSQILQQLARQRTPLWHALLWNWLPEGHKTYLQWTFWTTSLVWW